MGKKATETRTVSVQELVLLAVSCWFILFSTVSCYLLFFPGVFPTGNARKHTGKDEKTAGKVRKTAGNHRKHRFSGVSWSGPGVFCYFLLFSRLSLCVSWHFQLCSSVDWCVAWCFLVCFLVFPTGNARKHTGKDQKDIRKDQQRPGNSRKQHKSARNSK